MEILAGEILGFILIVSRVGGFLGASPFFSWQTIPMQVKIGFVVMVSVFFGAVNGFAVYGREIHVLEAIILIGQEIIYGVSMGIIFTLIFSVVKQAGRIIERQMGLSLSQIFDPMTGENAQPLSMMVEIFFILLFLAGRGHHLILVAISKSYEVYPAATIPKIGLMTENIIKSGSVILLLSLKLSVPILTAFLLMLIVLAVLARVAPESNILFMSLPLRVGLGIMMMGLFMPFFLSFVNSFAVLLDNLLPI
jgi:flagellar biosynthetic protein FliR